MEFPDWWNLQTGETCGLVEPAVWWNLRTGKTCGLVEPTDCFSEKCISKRKIQTVQFIEVNKHFAV